MLESLAIARNAKSDPAESMALINSGGRVPAARQLQGSARPVAALARSSPIRWATWQPPPPTRPTWVPGHVEYVRTGKADGPVESINYHVTDVLIQIRKIEFTGAGEAEIPALEAASERLGDREDRGFGWRNWCRSICCRCIMPRISESAIRRAAAQGRQATGGGERRRTPQPDRRRRA